MQVNAIENSDETVLSDNNGHGKETLPVMVLAALGVVYGDIGTSPIYAFRQALAAGQGGSSIDTVVLGLLSLIAWSLFMTVTFKYVFFVTRADNKGEGGTLSLMTLARKTFIRAPLWITALGVMGTALFFGDAMITPAVSVLSAVEGLEIIAPQSKALVVPITIVLILGVFWVQRFGTGKVASVFGPVMSTWFLVLGLTGLFQIVQNPQVLLALSPHYAAIFIAQNLGIALIVMGAVFLAVTGAEALYVDMGHFGRRPIVIAWFGLVFPCLLLNYFGQGAYVLQVGYENTHSPFFQMQPEWALLPFVILSTLATIIASQAVISGTFSLARQAIALNLMPRMLVQHTSATQSGQIYMPQVNSVLMIGVLIMVLWFQSSANLSAAYGIAVSGIMLVTLALLLVVMARKWRWQSWAVVLFGIVYAFVDGGFFFINSSKIADGGWVPLLVAGILSSLMAVWIRGRKRLSALTKRDEMPLDALVRSLHEKPPTIVAGTAVFLTADQDGAPAAMLHSLKHYKVLHEQNVILTIQTSQAPRVSDSEKIHIEAFNELFSRVVITFGYMETPNLPKALALARKLGWKFDIMNTSFFLSRRELKLMQKHGPLRNFEDRVFSAMVLNASDATEYFRLPTGRVVEIGMQVAY